MLQMLRYAMLLYCPMPQAGTAIKATAIDIGMAA